MKKLMCLFMSCIAVVVFCSSVLFAHCQIPCGIYDDQLRFESIYEDVATIEKAVTEIIRLSDQSNNYNQIVRWINAKEDHANNIMKIAGDYFLAQRIEVQENSDKKDKNYYHKISLLHKIIVCAMKTKQSADLANVEKLKILVSDFQKIYFDGK